MRPSSDDGRARRRELIVDDEPRSCPYFEERTAVLPLRAPLHRLTPGDVDACLAAGDRRWASFLYRPACPACRACEPLRIEVERFRARRYQRRAARKGNALLEARFGRPRIDAERLALFEAHRTGRGLGSAGEPAMTAEPYEAALLGSSVETVELSLRLEGRLVGVAIADRGAVSLSAVYCYYDPRVRSFGIGTYAVLRQVEYCRREGLRWLYLGYYIAGHPHMAYKARFLPHQLLVEGRWVERDGPPRELAGDI